MRIDEEPISRRRNGKSHPTTSVEGLYRRSRNRKRLWWYGMSGLFVCFLSFGLGSLVKIRHNVIEASARQMTNLEWMVLVTGDALAVDEVGRYLRQLPGVEVVSFVSAQDAYDRLRNDQLMFEDLSAVNVADLPSNWRVSWKPEVLDTEDMVELVEESRRVPGVVDIAYDERVLESNRMLRRFVYQLSAVLTGLAILFTAAAIFLLVRYIFFLPKKNFRVKMLAADVAFAFLCWSLGFVLVRQLIGQPNWHHFWGGLVVGLLHYLGTCFANVDRKMPS